MAAGGLEKKREKFFKICLTGQKNVGKTSIFNAIRGKSFTTNPKAEINYYSHSVNVDGENVKLKIWDTAGMEEYNSLTENYYRSAKGIIAVYSKVCSESFTHVLGDVQDVTNCDYAPDALFFLVGNKIDLSSDIQVPQERVNHLLTEEPDKFQRYFETSAKLHRGIHELFDGIAHSLVAAHARPVAEGENGLRERYENRGPRCCPN